VTYDEAFERVRKGERFENPEILKLANISGWISGWTIAHAQAYRGWTTEDPDILKLAYNNGRTVAHVQAESGWTTEDPDILSLKEKNGETVLDIMLSNGWLPQTEEEKLIVFTVKAGR